MPFQIAIKRVFGEKPFFSNERKASVQNLLFAENYKIDASRKKKSTVYSAKGAKSKEVGYRVSDVSTTQGRITRCVELTRFRISWRHLARRKRLSSSVLTSQTILCHSDANAKDLADHLK